MICLQVIGDSLFWLGESNNSQTGRKRDSYFRTSIEQERTQPHSKLGYSLSDLLATSPRSLLWDLLEKNQHPGAYLQGCAAFRTKTIQNNSAVFRKPNKQTGERATSATSSLFQRDYGHWGANRYCSGQRHAWVERARHIQKWGEYTGGSFVFPLLDSCFFLDCLLFSLVECSRHSLIPTVFPSNPAHVGTFLSATKRCCCREFSSNCHQFPHRQYIPKLVGVRINRYIFLSYRKACWEPVHQLTVADR